MPLSTLETKTLSRGFAAAKLVLEQLEPTLHALNVIYDSLDGVKTTVDQAGLDAVPNYSGLTKAQLDAGMYALTATLRESIGNAYSALAELAARA